MANNAAQLLRFVAFSTRMNLYKLPSLKQYFANEIGDFGAQKFMDRQSFFRIRANFKCVRDVNVDMITKQKDPLWKIRPVLDSVKHAMLEIPRIPDNSCVDEQIIPFTAGMPNKIFLKSKPHPVGWKLFSLADPSGTILSLTQVRKHLKANWHRSPREKQQSLLVFVREFSRGCTIYLDRFFTGLGVVRFLQEKKLNVTGTVQRNRLLRQNFAGECRKRFLTSFNKSKRRYCSNVLEGQSCCFTFEFSPHHSVRNIMQEMGKGAENE